MTSDAGGPGAGPSWRLRPATESDQERWRQLYAGYAVFYGVRPTAAAVDRVWSWILDPRHEVGCLLVEHPDGPVVGLAHYRPFARPLTGTTGCYLDDLYVDPDERGRGAADALLTELGRLAGVNGWSVVRWITADDNYRGRAKYDQFATRTGWVTYDMPRWPPAGEARGGECRVA